MAKLKPITLKKKVFPFTSFDNDKENNPAKIIFNRFPQSTESFIPIRDDLFSGIDLSKLSESGLKEKQLKEIQKEISNNLLSNFTKNYSAGLIDYKSFFNECIDLFEDFEYGESKVITINDFWQILPADAAEVIAREAYEYATQRDEFTMGELAA